MIRGGSITIMKEKKILGFTYTHNEKVKFMLYLVVGGTAALVEWGLFYLFLSIFSGIKREAFTGTVLAATALAFAIATLYHYFLGNVFVFEQGSRHERGAEVSLVFLVSTIGLLGNLVLMWIFTSPRILGLPPFYSKVLASAVVTVWNYGSRKKWIFK